MGLGFGDRLVFDTSRNDEELALVEFDGSPVDTIACKKMPQLCGVFAVNVLQYQKAHI